MAQAVEGLGLSVEDLAIGRMVRLMHEGTLESVSGRGISPAADTVCVHGDGPKALAFAARLREAFAAEEILVRSL